MSSLRTRSHNCMGPALACQGTACLHWMICSALDCFESSLDSSILPRRETRPRCVPAEKEKYFIYNNIYTQG